MNRNPKRQSGFTIVELMLSMAFISLMLVAIALCIMQIGSLYNRGETLRQVNQASRSLTTDFQRTLGGAESSAIVYASDYGRLCTGQFSYIWNLPDNSDGSLVYQNNRYEAEGEPIRLVRIVDDGAAYCTNPTMYVRASETQPVELLTEGNRALTVRSFAVSTNEADLTTGEALYRVTIMLGTDSQGAIRNDTCKPPADVGSDVDYCAVNEFSFVVRAGVR